MTGTVVIALTAGGFLGFLIGVSWVASRARRAYAYTHISLRNTNDKLKEQNARLRADLSSTLNDQLRL